MSEAELEELIQVKDGNNEARYVLGKLMIEDTSDKVQYNEYKGMSYIKQAAEKGLMDAIEYVTYWNIRFDKAP